MHYFNSLMLLFIDNLYLLEFSFDMQVAYLAAWKIEPVSWVQIPVLFWL